LYHNSFSTFSKYFLYHNSFSTLSKYFLYHNSFSTFSKYFLYTNSFSQSASNIWGEYTFILYSFQITIGIPNRILNCKIGWAVAELKLLKGLYEYTYLVNSLVNWSGNRYWVSVIVFNANFNNITVMSWLSSLLVEETGVPWEYNRPTASHWQTLSHNIVFYPAIGTFAVQICYTNKFLLYSY
jgi:hypothetical protein